MDNNVYNNMKKPNDECFTRKIDADKLVEYILKNNLVALDAKIWLPFKDENSNITLAFRENGFTNLITTDYDFFENSPDDFDVIISNPPFSGRTKLLGRLMLFDKPFILLQHTQAFNNQNFVNTLCLNKDISFICPSRRFGFIRDKIETTSAVFWSFWFSL